MGILDYFCVVSGLGVNTLECCIVGGGFKPKAGVESDSKMWPCSSLWQTFQEEQLTTPINSYM